jgi:hypothetical protein
VSPQVRTGEDARVAPLHEPLREQQAPVPKVARAPKPAHGSGSAVMDLQHTAGNKAVGQALARHRPAQTGLRRPEAIERFVHKAVAFFDRNPDGRLIEYALYLGADVNTELEKVGVPAVGVHVSKADNGASGQFFADSWRMELYPAAFTRREGVTTMGDLTPDEAALVAHTVYHEARHAEQHFRIARLDAAEGHAAGDELDAGVAAAAAAAPLTGRTGTAQELREAREWREIESGADQTYREAVTSWSFELHDAVKLAHTIDATNGADLRARIGRQLAHWTKDDQVAGYIRGHLADARSRKATRVAAEITHLDTLITAAQHAFAATPDSPTPQQWARFSDALLELFRAIDKAYRNQSIEADAYATGNAAYDAFEKADKHH